MSDDAGLFRSNGLLELQGAKTTTNNSSLTPGTLLFSSVFHFCFCFENIQNRQFFWEKLIGQ